MGVDLPENYSPHDDEPYMNPVQLEYFKRKLISWREHLLRESGETLEQMKKEETKEVDLLDRGTWETNTSLKLKTRDRYRKLIYKIESALERIKDGSYGYCEETGEEIGIGRLEARPIATLSIEAQEWHELMERKARAGSDETRSYPYIAS